MLDGEAGSLRARVESQLAVDRVQVPVHGARADEELLGDLGVGQPGGYQTQDIDLSGAEPGGVGRAEELARLLRRRCPEPPGWWPGRAVKDRNAAAPRQGWRTLRSGARSCPAPPAASWSGDKSRGSRLASGPAAHARPKRRPPPGARGQGRPAAPAPPATRRPRILRPARPLQPRPAWSCRSRPGRSASASGRRSSSRSTSASSCSRPTKLVS